ncbi:Sec7 domain protein [Aspergillus terreus]|uniref:Sec7 domain protein n=1 Tax=Aspergillus terreus TaxID=33178 RepID=A0A5M3ZA78_ASPTE|nr:hypothetical protein ATETN484_0012046400 [Aspergillus terreus]GFF19702.1 Sec7 domain protein [Aspergillus terreus]
MNPNTSPPRTPPAGSNYKVSKRHPRPSVRETFLDDVNPTDNTNSSNESGDERDPHDLSLSPKHAARTSIVDNMLLSLDQFASSGTSILDDYRLFNSVFESDLYGRTSQESSVHQRYRGHTFSSSVSSDPDYTQDEMSGRYTVQPRTRRSTSSSNYHSSLRRFGSARSPEGTGSRGQLYDYRNNHGGYQSSSRTTRKDSKGSTSSPMDFGPPLVRHRGDSTTERRSASFDYGTRQNFVPFSGTAEYDPLSYDGLDAAPTPSVPAGPRKHHAQPQAEQPATVNHQSSRTPVASRRNSIKSSRTNPVKKPRPENLGTGTLRGREKDLVNLDQSDLEPPPSIPALDPPAPSPTISYNKPAFAPPTDPTPTKERPGFFRRVFGSSRNASPGTSEPNPVDLSFSQENSPKDSNAPNVPKGRRQPLKNSGTGANSGREGPPQVVNKKSSFFRRRKKSIAENVPPPILLPQELGQKVADITKPEPSPVSSLRRVMDTYLDPAPGTVGPTKSVPSWITNAADGEKKTSGTPQKSRESTLSPNGASKAKYSLYPGISPSNAHETSFLGNISGDEESVPKSSDHDLTSASEQFQEMPAKDGLGLRDHELRRPETHAGSRSPSRLGPSDDVGPGLSPVVERFSQNSLSPIEGPGDAVGLDDMPAEPPGSSESGPGEDKPEAPSKSRPDASPKPSTSEASNYFTASNTPVVPSAGTPTIEAPENRANDANRLPGNEPSEADREQAQMLFDSQDQVVGNEPAAAWLGDPDRVAIRKAYMELFDWSDMNILASLRGLCNRLVLKGETQQVDRVLDAFSTRWCECNPYHGFKAADVVHTICYSLLLLNTDLHLADIEQKMTKNQFVRNTMPTIHRVAIDATSDRSGALPTGLKGKSSTQDSVCSPSDETERGGINADRPVNTPKLVNRLSRTDLSVKLAGDPESITGPLVSTPFNGTMRAWEQQVETVLRDFYSSIQKQRLPLHGAQPEKEVSQPPPNNLLGPNSNALRRSPSTVSKSGSDIYPRGRSADSRYGAARWSSKPRSRARLYPPSTMGSSRTSLDDQSSLWSPSGSSTWSKYSLGKLTSASVDSFGSEYMRGDYQQSIGFANALSQAIIREDAAHSIASTEDPERTLPLLEDETLQLAGAPWAKEGSLKHKHHLDSVDKRAKDRNWNECFAVIQQGWLRLFSFNSAKSTIRQKNKRHHGGVVVGGGNWTENAEEIWKFLLRQTIASALPPPGYSKSRPHVWALSLPTGAVHLFQAGTPDIVREFVSSANYWSARLSKEPLIGGISNIEYGWSDAVINNALVGTDTSRSPPSASGARPSLQSSIRSSIDQQGGVRPKLPADRVHISDWAPPQQSMMASNLSEAEQLKALQMYVKNVEDELSRHNELRPAMMLAYSPRHPNATKAMTNWERKSSYLLREIVKFRTYIDSLQAALEAKKKIYAAREEDTPAE